MVFNNTMINPNLYSIAELVRMVLNGFDINRIPDPEHRYIKRKIEIELGKKLNLFDFN